MNLVFCMAGLYKRFRDAGYVVPKFLLPFHGSTVLERVVREIVHSSGDAARGPVFEHVIFVANQRDRAFEPQVLGVLDRLRLPHANVKWVGNTSGQAQTALMGVDQLESLAGADTCAKPILFHNIDTILTGRSFATIAKALASADGFIDCIDSDSPHFSYVRTDATGRAVEVREKIVISRNATTGLYGFRSAEAFRRWSASASIAREFYISDVYRSMLSHGAHVVIDTPKGDVSTIILGTPEEYESLATAADIRRARAGLIDHTTGQSAHTASTAVDREPVR